MILFSLRSRSHSHNGIETLLHAEKCDFRTTFASLLHNITDSNVSSLFSIFWMVLFSKLERFFSLARSFCRVTAIVWYRYDLCSPKSVFFSFGFLHGTELKRKRIKWISWWEHLCITRARIHSFTKLTSLNISNILHHILFINLSTSISKRFKKENDLCGRFALSRIV